MGNQHTSINQFRKLRRLEFAFLALLLFALLFAFGAAQAASPVTFGASVTNANGELSTVLTWDAPGASACVGSGHKNWNGDKLASGTQQLPTIALSGTYPLTLTCSFPGDTTAKVSWVPPTKNTDGSALTNLAGYRIVYGTAPGALTQVEAIDNPAVASRNINDLAPGTWYFAVKAVNALGVESSLSNVASKVITAAYSESASVSLTVNPVPLPPQISVE